MQSWWASRVQGHGLTHEDGGSEGSSSVRQMKHRRGSSGRGLRTSGGRFVSGCDDAGRVPSEAMIAGAGSVYEVQKSTSRSIACVSRKNELDSAKSCKYG